MNRRLDDALRAPIRPAALHWAGAQPRSSTFDDIYYSAQGLDEKRYVFLDGNDLAERFAANKNTFVIGEVGFGTGLNFLLAWRLWRRTARAGRLCFLAAECAPLSPGDLVRAHGAWPELADFAARLRASLPPLWAGAHRLDLDADVELLLLYGDAAAQFGVREAAVDAWFLDGFAPAKNPALWSAELAAEIARLSAQDATFATYSAAGDVRRNFESAGFTTIKRTGFGAKRHMLVGRLARAARKRLRAPWCDPALAPPAPVASVAIIGAGIAGAALAFEARRAGLAPAIFDPAGPAAGASGNPAGLVMPKLDLGAGPAARFHLAAFAHTIRLLKTIGLASTPGVRVDPIDHADRDRLERLAAGEGFPEGALIRDGAAYLVPEGAVIDPREFVRALLGGAQLIPERVSRFEATQAGLAVITDTSRHDGFAAAILANGIGARRHVEARALPLAAVAGQIDWFARAAPPPHGRLSGGYALPAPDGGLVVGASYDHWSTDEQPAPSRAASARNVAYIAQFAPEIAHALSLEEASPRASLRCQTPDRVPVAGPLPDLGFYAGAYDGLRTGRREAYPRAQALAGFFILAGLASRGLSTAPLAAAHIVALLTGSPSPLDAGMSEALDPARFFIRDLKRARPPRRA